MIVTFLVVDFTQYFNIGNKFRHYKFILSEYLYRSMSILYNNRVLLKSFFF